MLQDYNREFLRRHRSVIMCRIYRETEDGRWKVEAIGEILESGYTMNYSPIHAAISQRIAMRKREGRA